MTSPPIDPCSSIARMESVIDILGGLTGALLVGVPLWMFYAGWSAPEQRLRRAIRAAQRSVATPRT